MGGCADYQMCRWVWAGWGVSHEAE